MTVSLRYGYSVGSPYRIALPLGDALALNDILAFTGILQIVTTVLPEGVISSAYSYALVSEGGIPTLTWSVVSGSLPAGLSLSSAGVISGTPTTQQTASFTVQVTDGVGQTAQMPLSIIVNTAASIKHYLYVVSPGPVIKVYDIDSLSGGVFTLVATHTLGSSTLDIRGVVASWVDSMLYISYGCNAPAVAGGCDGHLVKYDLVNNVIIYNVTQVAGIDSHAITPDGKTLYMPTGEGDHTHSSWEIIPTSTGIATGSIDSTVYGPHNTAINRAGTHVYMGSIKQDTNGDGNTYFIQSSIATGLILSKIGPLQGKSCRPFTMDTTETYAFVCTMGLIGFQVGRISDGAILYTVDLSTMGFSNSNCTGITVTCSHGIALTTDNSTVYVIDYYNNYVHVFDVTGLPGSAPSKIASIALTHNYTSTDPWLIVSKDNKYVFVSRSGDVIATASNTIVGYVSALNSGKEDIEIDFNPDGTVQWTPLSRSSYFS